MKAQIVYVDGSIYNLKGDVVEHAVSDDKLYIETCFSVENIVSEGVKVETATSEFTEIDKADVSCLVLADADGGVLVTPMRRGASRLSKELAKAIALIELAATQQEG